MILNDVIKNGFARFCNGKCDSISILDRDGETLKVVKIENVNSIDADYLNSTFISIGSSSIKPNRVRIRIDYSAE